MAGSAFKDKRVVDLVAKEFVAVLIDTLAHDETKMVAEHGVSVTPHLVIGDSEGEQWGVLSDVHTADEVIAEVNSALALMRESAGK